jgi:membrane associated rhomboid family serine protease
MAFSYQSVPRGIRTLIIITVAVWIAQHLPFIGGAINEYGPLVPVQTFGRGQLWRCVTYLFLHDPSGPFHILFNMLTLWMFGVELEEMWGTRKFVLFYLIGGAGAGLFSLLTFPSLLMWMTPVIGASGAVLALLTVYALYFPRRQILLFFIVPVNVLVAVAIFGFISLYGSMQSAGNVSHLTHLGGIVIGLLYVKGFPFLSSFLEHARDRAAAVRRAAEERKKNADRDHFETVIDPILKKISEHGMESLTKDEKKALEEASKRKRGGAGDDGRIIPFRRK